MRKNASRFIRLALVGALINSGCATLTRDHAQRIPVTSSPAGATVSVNGKALGTTPLEIRLPRRFKKQVILIESPGYNPVEIRPRRKALAGPLLGDFLLGIIPGVVPAGAYLATHEESSSSSGLAFVGFWALGAAVCGGIIAAIDLGSGNGYDFKPKELDVTLTKAEGSPRVVTILVDARELRNMTWIRVRRD